MLEKRKTPQGLNEVFVELRGNDGESNEVGAESEPFEGVYV